MKIALFHNYYQLRGGEDVCFELECESLAALGHEVFPYTVHNNTVFTRANAFSKALIAWQAPRNPSSYEAIRQFLVQYRPDVSHVHNWFPVISPAVYEANKGLNIPVVQTLHNYRLGCAAGTFRRNGSQCVDCLCGSKWAAVANRCYRNSSLGSLAWKRTIDAGWNEGGFLNDVSLFIAPSGEVARRHEEMGIARERIKVVPNACQDPFSGSIPTLPSSDGGAVFLGRLVAEKGVDTLIDAWKILESQTGIANTPTLTIVGSGPERVALESRASELKSVKFLGQLPYADAMEKVRSAAVLAFPSRWAEPFGLGVIEAMAAERPVIASDIGAPSEIVDHNRNGILVPPDQPLSIAKEVKALLENPRKLQEMGSSARAKYLTNYQPTAHAKTLANIYESIQDQFPINEANTSQANLEYANVH